MQKIILSRKGFDSSAGGYPSPILDDGTLLSLPIPASNNENTGIYYKDLNYKGLSYLDLMKQLKLSKYDENSQVHLDPDLNYFVCNRKDEWEAIFGQCDPEKAPQIGAASQLDKNGVGTGDLFLFYGWFRNTIKTDSGYKYDRKDKKGRHIVWGYLEVGQKIKIDAAAEYPDHYLSHPHFKDRNRTNNTAFVATKILKCFPELRLKGSGIFKYNDTLVLSFDENQKSIWKLPICFYQNLTYHSNQNRWTKVDNYCILKSVGRGQEFIIDSNKNEEVLTWTKKILSCPQ